LGEYTVQAEGFWPAMVTTAHVATGSLIIALSLVIALRSVRMFGIGSSPAKQASAAWGTVA